MNQNDIKALNELKMLSIEIINKAGGGNPGICLGMAPVLYSLFTRVLNVYPQNNQFFNRDRVILSSGHMTPLYYAMMHMAGFSITKEDLMNFRRCNSNTPGLPELNNPLGMDATTGIAGDGVGIAVGSALGRRYFEALIKEEDDKVNLVDYTTYCFLSDADMMSGASEEAFNIAATQKLSNLVFLYDSNKMTGEGPATDVMIDDIEKKFNLKGFYVDSLKDATNIREIARAIEAAKNSKKPALVIFKTIIGKDSFNEGKNIVHSGVLSTDDTNTLRRKFDIFLPPFEVSKDSVLHINNLIEERMKKRQDKWQKHYARVKSINSEKLNHILELLETGQTIVPFDSHQYNINDGYRESLIETNHKIMNLIAPKSSLFLGGSSGVSLQTQGFIGVNEVMSATNPKARNIRFGIREKAMANILNGISLSGLKTFGATPLIYADEMLLGIRSSALMDLPVTYVLTHDSLYTSEEGAIRIPVEQISHLRSIPNLTVYRPADILEVMGCWETILHSNKPSAIIITRNSIPKLPNSNSKEIQKGAYIIKKEQNKLDGIIIATGSEVVSAIQIAYDLFNKGIDLRVVSMPSVELFEAMDKNYQKMILPDNIKTIVIEASKDNIWYQFATSKDYILGIDDFPYSGVTLEVLQNMEYDYASLKTKVEDLMK